VHTVAFAAPIAQASTWDSTMQYDWGSHVGWEAWHKGIDIHLAPALNIARFPRNGRNFEYMGEDPYLAGKGAAAATRGLQSQHVVATLKHYALNNHEVNRMSVSSDVDPRTAHEIYLAAFETAVEEGQPGAVMCSYNRVDFVPPYDNSTSIYACEHPTLLTTYLKQELGFDGWVMSDWNATHSTVAAALAGLDQEMAVFPGTFFADPLKQAVQNGQVPQSRLDDMVIRITRAMFRVGVFDHPPAPQPDAYAADVETPDEIAFARRLAEQGTVLLKNDGRALPLVGHGKRIAVIGRAAGPDGVLDVYNGGGSAHVPQFGNKSNVVSPLQGIQERAAADGDVVVYDDGSSPEAAAALASTADVAVVFGYYTEAEGGDRASLSLDSGGDALISAVAGSQPNTAVVLNTGGPALMPWIGNVKAVLEAWYPGQEYGHAIAALLFGDVNPSAKLPQTFPRAEADLPVQTPEQYPGVDQSGIPHARYSEGLLVGYRWFDAKGIQPLFPFGHGLSYTTFGYSSLKVKSGRTVTVTFTIKNTGDRAGAEVGQLYLGFPAATGEPPKQLKGFQKVYLEPGQSKRVTLKLDRRAFSYWDAGRQDWEARNGSYRVFVGSSSRDIRLTRNVRLSG
jgi:beta-glucosidase